MTTNTLERVILIHTMHPHFACCAYAQMGEKLWDLMAFVYLMGEEL